MVEVHVPRLTDRKEDLPLLQRSFIMKFAAQYGKTVRGLTPRAQILLGRHSWPGNVRELENVIGHACMMVLSDTVDVRDLPEYLWDSDERRAASAGIGVEPAATDAGVSLEEHERRLIVQALESAAGNQTQAARLLRIGRDALRYKVKKYNL
jgi:DNA-binding NtrC family response regulator